MKYKMPFDPDYSIKELVDNFLENKAFETEYEITFIDKEDELEYVTMSKFSDQELVQLKQLKAKYGMDNIHSHLSEVFEDPDLLSDIFINPDGVIDIDLEHPIKLIKLTIYRLKEGNITQGSIHIKIHPNDYRKLLLYSIEDSGMNFNKLRHADSGVYERMLLEIDKRIGENECYSENYPYLIVLTEIEDDVTKFLKEHPDIKPKNNIGYSMIP